MNQQDYLRKVKDLLGSSQGREVLSYWKRMYVQVELGSNSLTDRDLFAKIGIHNFIVTLENLVNLENKPGE